MDNEENKKSSYHRTQHVDVKINTNINLISKASAVKMKRSFVKVFAYLSIFSFIGSTTTNFLRVRISSWIIVSAVSSVPQII